MGMEKQKKEHQNVTPEEMEKRINMMEMHITMMQKQIEHGTGGAKNLSITIE